LSLWDYPTVSFIGCSAADDRAVDHSGFFASPSFSGGSAAIDNCAAPGDSLPQPGKSPPMRIKWLLAMAVIAGLVGTGIAFSQNRSQPAVPPNDKVKSISKREWNKMKEQWAKQTDKWASCNRQSDDQKLSGRKSWSFIAGCMTS
jgi:hypothetical protein